MKYIEKQPGWKTSIISSNAPELGGFKEVVFSVEGSGVYGKLKYESGVHRVQRVPVTEAGGRIHTSTATVAVLPQKTSKSTSIWTTSASTISAPPGPAASTSIRRVLPSA